MEDILDLHTRPYDPQYPQVCMDEVSRQLLGTKRPPQPLQPGKPERLMIDKALVPPIRMCNCPCYKGVILLSTSTEQTMI